MFPKPTLADLILDATTFGKAIVKVVFVDATTANTFRLANLSNRQVFELLTTETSDKTTQEGLRIRGVTNANFEIGSFQGSSAGSLRGLSFGVYPRATPTVLTPWMDINGSTGEITSWGGIHNIRRYADSSAGVQIVTRKYRGSVDSPQPLLTNDVILQILGQGYNGSTIATSGAVQMQATADFSSISTPTRLLFNTCPVNSIASSTRMVITEDGRVVIGVWNVSNPVSAVLTLTGNNGSSAEANSFRFHDTGTITGIGQVLGKMEFYSGDTSAPGAGVKAWIASVTESAVVANAAIVFATDTNTGTPVERMRIKATGVVTFERLHGQTAEVTSTPGGTTQTITLDNGTMQTLALTSATGATTVTLTVPTIGSARGSIIVKQHATTPRNIIWAVSSGTIKWLGTQPTWSSDATNAVRDVRWRWDGSVMYLEASAAG